MADATVEKQKYVVVLTQKFKTEVAADSPDEALVNAQGEAPTTFDPTSFSVKEAK